MELIVVYIVLGLSSTWGFDQVPVKHIPGCRSDDVNFDLILKENMMECGSQLNAACCSSRTIPSILQGVGESDTRCVCCKKQTNYLKSIGNVSTEPCQGDCYRPIYTKEKNLPTCDPDNNVCGSLLANNDLTCDNSGGLEPTCCSKNDGVMTGNQFHCYCCPSHKRSTGNYTCDHDCLYPSSIQANTQINFSS